MTSCEARGVSRGKRRAAQVRPRLPAPGAAPRTFGQPLTRPRPLVARRVSSAPGASRGTSRAAKVRPRLPAPGATPRTFGQPPTRPRPPFRPASQSALGQHRTRPARSASLPPGHAPLSPGESSRPRVPAPGRCPRTFGPASHRPRPLPPGELVRPRVPAPGAPPHVWPASHPATPLVARRVSSASNASTGRGSPHVWPASHPRHAPLSPGELRHGSPRSHGPSEDIVNHQRVNVRLTSPWS